MPYDTRPLEELSRLSREAFQQSVPGLNIGLWPNAFAVSAKVMAVLDFEHDLRRARLWKQAFASLADDEVWLDRHGYELGLTRRAASFAIGTATVAGTAGITIPAGVLFARSDGVLFQTRVSANAPGSSVTLDLESAEAGVVGNTDASAVLTLVGGQSVPATLGASATLVTMGGGAEKEDREAWRERILARKRNPPQGGSATDWIAWAREVSGVQTVEVDSYSNTERRVWLSFTMAGRVNGIPEAGDVAAVQAYLNDTIRRPVTARVTVHPPIAETVNVTISGLDPDSATIRAAIAIEMAAMFSERVRTATPNRAFVLSRSWISEAISRAAGENKHVLTTPNADITFSTAGHRPVLGTITYS